MLKIANAFAGLLVAITLVVSCSKNDKKNPVESQNPPAPDPLNLVRDTFSGTYSLLPVNTHTFLRIQLASFQDSIYCNDSAMVHVALDSLRVEYLITSANGLTLYWPDNGDVDTNEYVRSGSGSGLVGTWLRDTILTQSKYLDTISETVTIRSDNAFLRTLASRINFVHFYISEILYPGYLAPYNVTLDTNLGPMALKIFGNVTQEIVTIQRLQNRDILFKSSLLAHSDYTFYFSPDSCPNPQWPAWLGGVLSGNLK
jgi:hypothetical protein